MAERISQAEFEHRCKLGATQDVLVDGLGYVYWTSRAGTAIGPWGNKGSGKTRAYILPVVLPKRGMPDLYLDCAKVAIVLPAFLDPDFGVRKKESEEKLQELFKKHYTDQSTNKLDEWSYNKIKKRIEEGSISMADEMPLDIKYSDELVNYFDYHTGYDSRKIYSSQIKEQGWDWQEKRDEYLAGEGRNMLMSSVLPPLNVIGGVGISIAKATTLAGQGKYITSKGLVRKISTLPKLTKHAQPYAQAGKLISQASYVGIGLGVFFDSVSYSKDEISGEKLVVNTGITGLGVALGYLMGSLVALPLTVGYFGVDQYYPGGWEGYGKDEMERNRTRPYAGPKY